MIDARVQRCLGSASSVLVGTVDLQGRPSCCHAAAIKPDDDLKTVAVYLPIATSQQIIQDIANTHRLAVSATHVIDHFSIQLKGTAHTARLAGEGEAAFVEHHHEAFADVLLRLGVPRRITRSIAHWPAFVVDMHVEEVFEQTPGPNAGAPLR